MLIMWFGGCYYLFRNWIKVTSFFHVTVQQKAIRITPFNHTQINRKMEMNNFIFQYVSSIFYPSLHLHSIHKYLKIIKMGIELGDLRKKTFQSPSFLWLLSESLQGLSSLEIQWRGNQIALGWVI